MSRILRIYVIKEVVLPMVLTLMTIIFVMLVGKLYKLITLLMQPSVSFLKFADALLSLIPFLMILAVPMAILIGALIGVGRMTLDREILATRASGINLFRIFVPMIFVGLLISMGLMAMASGPVPRLLQHFANRINEMEFAMISALEPGQFHDKDDLAGYAGANFEFYFRERDVKDPAMMKGILLKLEESGAKKKKDADRGAKAPAGSPAAAGKTPSVLDNIVSSATMAQAGALAPAAAQAAAGDEETSATQPGRPGLTLITAESGTVVEGADEVDDTGKKTQRTTLLCLTNGTLHNLNPKDGTYYTAPFTKLVKRMFSPMESKKREQTMSNKELRTLIDGLSAGIAEAKQDDDKDKVKDLTRDRGKARRELTQRYSLSLASFVFILIGIPLAIWVRPSGKSWGILMAVGLMLIYYVILNAGLGMVEYDKSFGYLVSFSPNLLFLALGAGLWWQSVRS